MSVIVWFTVALALWHFTIFVPDRFWQGIIGALLGCLAGGLISGAIIELLLLGNSLSETDAITFLAAVPGTLIGAWAVYQIGVRRSDHEPEEA